MKTENTSHSMASDKSGANEGAELQSSLSRRSWLKSSGAMVVAASSTGFVGLSGVGLASLLEPAQDAHAQGLSTKPPCLLYTSPSPRD